jgi:hypothetical protein
MASSKPTLNPLTDTPTNKTQITKPFMRAFMKSEKASVEDREWFKKIVSNPENQKEYKNQLDGTVYTDIDIPKVRKAFVDRFFPQLNEKKKSTTFIDDIMGL